MPSLFDRTCGIEDPIEIYDLIERNYPGRPKSRSRKLWKLRHACDISPHNPSPEKMLEKAVAMLGKSCHMPGWFNQCPVASGIVDSGRNRKNAVDLVHWSKSGECARLIELKWASNDPRYALREILRYGVAYIFCRVHRNELCLERRPLMDANHVALEVVAPRQFYSGHDEKKRFACVSKSLDEFARSKIGEKFTMSLNALAFPAKFKQEFKQNFKSGQDVKEKCFTKQLSDEGRRVRDAFCRLDLVWPG